MPIDFEHGPYVRAAMLCERVLIEQDGVKSAIRIVDRVIHQPPVGPAAPEAMQPFKHNLTLFVSLMSGWTRGSYPIEIRFVKPSGESKLLGSPTVFFEGDEDRGVDLVVNLMMDIEQPGLFWFHVSLEGRALSRIPFRVIYTPQIIPQLPGTGNP